MLSQHKVIKWGNWYRRWIRESESLPTQKNCGGPWRRRRALKPGRWAIWPGCWHPLIFGRAQCCVSSRVTGIDQKGTSYELGGWRRLHSNWRWKSLKTEHLLGKRTEWGRWRHLSFCWNVLANKEPVHKDRSHASWGRAQMEELVTKSPNRFEREKGGQRASGRSRSVGGKAEAEEWADRKWGAGKRSGL